MAAGTRKAIRSCLSGLEQRRLEQQVVLLAQGNIRGHVLFSYQSGLHGL